jgi:hypothetical protein
MQQSRSSLRWLRRSAALPVGLLFLTAFSGQAQATTAADVCATVGNSCAGGVANINVVTPIADNSTLDFTAAGFPTVNVNSGGKLELETKKIGQGGLSCPAKPTTLAILNADDLTIKNGGEITGSFTGVPSGHLNAGSWSIRLSGNFVIEPGGKWTSDRLGGGNGRPGNLLALVDGIIDVQADPSGTPRGIISANTTASSRFSFTSKCGLTEITLVATGDGASPTIRNAGTIENVSPPGGNEGFIGGVISIVAGGTEANLATPFPGFPSAIPVTGANPPDNNATFLLTETGLINIDAKDSGGGQVYIFACFVTVNGLIQVGGNAHTGVILGREQLLPVLVSIVANETLTVLPTLPTVPGIADPGVADPPGGIQADLRQGFKQHEGQGLTDASQGLGDGCKFTVQNPPGSNGPKSGSGKGGADVCLTARDQLTINQGQLVSEFAVRTRTGVTSGSQVGGTSLNLSTEGAIEATGRAITCDGVGSNSSGGEVVMQASEDAVVNSGALVQCNRSGTATGGSIDVEAVNGAIIEAGGQLNALTGGSIFLRECIVNAGDNPAANPPATLLAASCGVPNAVKTVPILLPCGGCFCIDDISVRNNVLTIRGAGLEGVERVEFPTDCNPAFVGGVLKAQFLTLSDTRITLTLPANVSGKHVVLSNSVGPSSSCSHELVP